MIKNFFVNIIGSTYARYVLNLFHYKRVQVTLALILMVVISLTEGVSLLILIPLLQLVGLDVSQGSLSQMTGWVSQFFSIIGLQPTLISVLILYIAVITTSAILYRFQTLKTSQIQYQYAAYLRRELYQAIINSDWLYFTRTKSSKFAHALTNEIERIGAGTGQFLSLLAGLMILVVYMAFALKIAGMITGIIFIVGVAILLILRRKASKSRTRGQEITTTTHNLYHSIMQHLDGVKTIKSLGIQEKNIQIFSAQNQEVAEKYQETIKGYADVKLLFDVGTVIILSIIVVVLIEVVKIPNATLFLLIYLFVRMIPQFSIIQRNYQYFINMIPAYQNVTQLKKQYQEHQENFHHTEKIKLKKNISLEKVSFTYPEHKHFQIKNLNLQIYAGKTTALAGPSGGGKTTIADLIMGLIRPEEGEITIDGRSFTNQDQIIGYVAQDTFLFNQTIRNNLLLSQPHATDKELINALKQAEAYHYVSQLPKGLDTTIGERGVKLSGGERQRLAIARALLKRPSLLILDEATSNLDTENEKRIIKTIDNLHGQITMLIIAHRLSTIKKADKIYIIDQGEIKTSGTWKQLKNHNEHFHA